MAVSRAGSTEAGTSLASLTTLRLGGPARRLIEAGDDDALVRAVADADAAGEPALVLGGGSNVVIADEGFPGVVVLVRSRGVQVVSRARRVRLTVAAGEELDTLAARAAVEGWAGLEALSGIPGLVGATPVQNVGAYGQEIAETLRFVRAYDRQARAVVRLSAAECGFGYRTSVFKREPRFVVLSVELELQRDRLGGPVRYGELAAALAVGSGGRAPVAEVRDAVLSLRRTKGMVVDPDDPDSTSVGSFFTNPVLEPGVVAAVAARARALGVLAAGAPLPTFAAANGARKVPAAWLIEKAGFGKGVERGGVGTSRKHALALVNRGGGTTGELLALAREIRDTVQARFGVRLEPEPVLVGVSL